jgi:hypothetical protein
MSGTCSTDGLDTGGADRRAAWHNLQGAPQMEAVGSSEISVTVPTMLDGVTFQRSHVTHRTILKLIFKT